MKLGFVGCGTIASAMVTGLCSTRSAGPITLSPRNAQVAAGLASRFANVQIAPTNQAVLDASEVVVLAVRPQIASGVLSELRFRPDHHVVSLIAALPLECIRSGTTPAALVTRAVPLPSVALRQGPTAIHPPTQLIKALFEALGTAIELDDESEFDAFAAATAIMASYFAFASTVSGWMTRNGVAPDNARTYVGEMLRGMAATSLAAPDRSFNALAEEHQTRGGLNEQVLQLTTRDGSFVALDRALDTVLKRLQAGASQWSSSSAAKR
jgi:pyrroline-5-carboxylate reductase